MELMKSDVMFKVNGAKFVHQQRVSLRPNEHHYENEGEPEYIKYSCQLCDSLASYPSKAMDKDEQFNRFSFAKGTEQCPCCGIYIDWNSEECEIEHDKK